MYDFKRGNEVYFFIEYEGLLKGIISSINVENKPATYIINSDEIYYDVSMERVFATKERGKRYIAEFLLDNLDVMSAKVNSSSKDILFIMKVYLEDQKYRKKDLDKYINKKVEILLTNNIKYTGILCYKKEAITNEIKYENIYYLLPESIDNDNIKKYISFCPREIKKLKEI